jgi:LytR cell envelope-related transcriptional attenuator
MKTSEDLWRWIWQDDDVLDERALADLLDGDGLPAAPTWAPGAAPVDGDELWERLIRDEPLLDAAFLDEEAHGVAAPPVIDVPLGPPPVEEEPETRGPVRLRRRTRVWGRSVRFMALLLVAAVVGAVAPQVIPAVLSPNPDDPLAPGAPPKQRVVAWSVVDDELGFAYVAVAAAGIRPPVVVAVPGDVTINLPGQGLGTVREAAVTGDQGLVGVALENLLGVPVDGAEVMTVDELAEVVDGMGAIQVADQSMGGEAVARYLTEPGAGRLPDERFLRWQDVLDGVLAELAGRTGAVAPWPHPLRGVLGAFRPEPADLLALPVVDLGSGLLRPDEAGVRRLVAERFVPLGGDEVRLVVLNGVGEPGIGEQVARTLIPHGFRLMQSTNANRFDVRVTRITATSEEDIAAARRARRLLGAGQVLLGAQPQLADVIVVVGRDFAGGR